MLSGVGSDRVEGDPIPIVEFGIVRRKGTHYARVRGSHCQHLVDLSAHAVVAAHAAAPLQMKPVDARGQFHRLDDVIGAGRSRVRHSHSSFSSTGMYESNAWWIVTPYIHGCIGLSGFYRSKFRSDLVMPYTHAPPQRVGHGCNRNTLAMLTRSWT